MDKRIKSSLDDGKVVLQVGYAIALKRKAGGSGMNRQHRFDDVAPVRVNSPRGAAVALVLNRSGANTMGGVGGSAPMPLQAAGPLA